MRVDQGNLALGLWGGTVGPLGKVEQLRRAPTAALPVTHDDMFSGHGVASAAHRRLSFDGPNRKAAERLQRSLTPLDLPKLVSDALLTGVAWPRTLAPEGRRGVLKVGQARRAAESYSDLPSRQRSFVLQLLHAAGGVHGRGDALCERALILKALAARTPFDSQRKEQLAAFAKAIRGVPRAALLHATTLVDIDSSYGTSAVDTVALRLHRPTGPRRSRYRTNDDGLLQRYEVSCGPAVAETLLGERDPVYAWTVYAAGGPQKLGRGTPSDTLQRHELARFGVVPIERRGLHDYRRLKVLCADLVACGKLSDSERRAVLRYCGHGEAHLTRRAKRGLSIVRRHGRFPSANLIARMRRAHPASPKSGMDAPQMRRTLRSILGPLGALHTRTLELAPGRSSRAFVRRHVAALARAAQGDGAALGTSDHWWAVVDARRCAQGYRFLLHDTWSGITAVVPENELADGTFTRRHFGWQRDDTVDTLILLRS